MRRARDKEKQNWRKTQRERIFRWKWKWKLVYTFFEEPFRSLNGKAMWEEWGAD